jgi:hypothetical protein
MHQARRLEGELEVKLQALTKLCSGYESTYRSRQQEGQGLGPDQVWAAQAQGPLAPRDTAMWPHCRPACSRR